LEQGEAGPLKVFGLSKVEVPQRTEKVHKMSSTVWSQQLGAMSGTVRGPEQCSLRPEISISFFFFALLYKRAI